MPSRNWNERDLTAEFTVARQLQSDAFRVREPRRADTADILKRNPVLDGTLSHHQRVSTIEDLVGKVRSLASDQEVDAEQRQKEKQTRDIATGDRRAYDQDSNQGKKTRRENSYDEFR